MSDVQIAKRVRLALRVTAAIAGIQAAGHAALFLSARPTHGSEEAAVIAAMRAQSFDFGAFGPRSYWDLYFGYGLLAVVFAFFVAAILWLTADWASEPRHMRRIAVVVVLAVTAHAIIIARYFFVLPFAFDIVVIGGLAVSLLLSARKPARTEAR